ncbi:hypothetical protein FWH30_00530 [Microgenomates group bacterium]|nr:hypothetical protein [Microgenomates group bacterium]
MKAKKKRGGGEILISVFVGLMALVALAYLLPMLVVDIIGFGHNNLSEQERLLAEEKAENEAKQGEEIVISLGNESEDLTRKDIDQWALSDRETAKKLGEMAMMDMTEDMVEYWVFLSRLKQEDIVTYEKEITSGQVTEKPVKITQYLPVKNGDLPEGLWLKNTEIGLNAQVYQGAEIDLALERGVVEVPGYGKIGAIGAPVIMAAHKHGMLWWWNSSHGRENSFYYLDQLRVGNQMVVIYDQREWRYEIYNTEYGERIEDYQADLILYTCRFLVSEQRYFVSLRLIDPASYGEIEII